MTITDDRRLIAFICAVHDGVTNKIIGYEPGGCFAIEGCIYRFTSVEPDGSSATFEPVNGGT